MKDFEKILEEINKMTIDDLPDIDITEEQKDTAKKRIFKSVEALKKRNKELSINISKQEVLEISDYLGEKCEDYLNGVKHGRVLREVALKACNLEVINKYEEIVTEVFTINGNGNGNNIGWMVGGILYFKIYITLDKLIIYSFNEFYKVLNKVEINLDEVKGAGRYKTKMYYIEYEDKVIYLGYTLEETKIKLDEMMDIFKRNGVKDEGEKKSKRTKNIITGCILVYIAIMLTLFILNHI